MSTYKRKLADPRWQRKRLEILSRDDFTCVRCGDSESELHVHHKRYSGKNPWESAASDLETVCWRCHQEGHGKPAALTVVVNGKDISHMVRRVWINRGQAEIGCLDGTRVSFEKNGEEYYAKLRTRRRVGLQAYLENADPTLLDAIAQFGGCLLENFER